MTELERAIRSTMQDHAVDVQDNCDCCGLDYYCYECKSYVSSEHQAEMVIKEVMRLATAPGGLSN